MLTFLSPTTSILTVLSICATPKTHKQHKTHDIKPFSCCLSIFSILSLFESVLTLVKAACFTRLFTTILKSLGNLYHISSYHVNQPQPIMCHLVEHLASGKQRNKKQKQKMNKTPETLNHLSGIREGNGRFSNCCPVTNKFNPLYYIIT